MWSLLDYIISITKSKINIQLYLIYVNKNTEGAKWMKEKQYKT
nr:MAG TPA: hypothetical protein [Caudoviricetes sp.]